MPHNLIPPKEVVHVIQIADKDGQLETVHDWTSFGAKIVGQPGVGLPFFDCMKNTEGIIRGGIAANIVGEMLRKAGYFVYRFGYEETLPALAQRDLPQMRKDSVVAEKIRTMPDFVVMDKGDNIFLVEVKYRSNGENDLAFKEWLRRSVRYWPEAKLMLVHPYKPYFQISTILDYAKSGKLYPLERDRFLRVNKEILISYEPLLKKYMDC